MALVALSRDVADGLKVAAPLIATLALGYIVVHVLVRQARTPGRPHSSCR